MHVIGIDMSKDTFHVAFDESLVEVFKNTDHGIQTFIETLQQKNHHTSDTVIGTEATGVYHLLLSETLRKLGWNIKVINPLLTHRMIASTLRRVKTDRHDALAVRKTLLTGAGYTYTDTPEVLGLKNARAGTRSTLAHANPNQATNARPQHPSKSFRSQAP